MEKQKHKYVWKTTKKATCTQEGSKQKVCSTCKRKENAVSIPKKEHSWGDPYEVQHGGKRYIRRDCTVCSKYLEEEEAEKAEPVSVSIVNKAPEADKDINNGYLTCDRGTAQVGDTITVQAHPHEGYEVDQVVASAEGIEDTNPASITVTSNTDVLWAYTFQIPDDLNTGMHVTVSATFKLLAEANDGWVLDDGTDQWTYWDNGTQVTGWFQDGGSELFYCNPSDGFLQTGWFTDGGSTWHYSYTADDAVRGNNREGAIAANRWVQGVYDQRWFYLNAEGAMETNTWVRTSNSAPWSWVGADGAWSYGD